MPLKLNDLNEFLICKLCHGYLINATILNDCCFDTFCKSCIIKHLERDDKCPKCKRKLSADDPFSKLIIDIKKQNLVYKIVPNLFANEKERRTIFYKEFPEDKINNELTNNLRQGNYIWSLNDLIDISLEYLPLAPINSMNTSSNAKRRYLRVESGMSVSHLKKWLKNKFDLSFNQKVVLLVNTEVLADSLKMIDLAYIFSEEKYPLNIYFYYYKTPIGMKSSLKSKLNKKLKIKKKIKKINGNCIVNNGYKNDQLQNASKLKKTRLVMKRQIGEGRKVNRINGLNEVNGISEISRINEVDSNANQCELTTSSKDTSKALKQLTRLTKQIENSRMKSNTMKSPKAKRAKLENLNDSNSLNSLNNLNNGPKYRLNAFNEDL